MAVPQPDFSRSRRNGDHWGTTRVTRRAPRNNRRRASRA